VASSRTIVIAGAGIGGLSAALMLARSGFRVTLLEQAEQLQETGAGIQLSPNATRILIALGLGERLRRDASIPQAIAIKTATGQPLARIPLGDEAAQRYGAPYWSIHRGDLQAALVEAVQGEPGIALHLGTRVENFAVHTNAVRITGQQGSATVEHEGIALIGADGLWSALRAKLGHRAPPQFQHRTAWRAMVPAAAVEPAFRTAEAQLWLGQDAHLVHYPVKSGAQINIVAIVTDRWAEPGWSAEGRRGDLLARYSRWSEPARRFLAVPERWQKWALYDLPPLHRWSDGPVTLLGDAAHPMLPFLAQGAAMAIEDAAVLANNLSRHPDDPTAAMQRYEQSRRDRAARVQHAARSNGRIYHAGAGAAFRNLFLRLAGGNRMLARYDWLYDERLMPPDGR
jgi:salicylate hydroxylase